MPVLLVGAKGLGRWWTICLVGIILLLRDTRAQNPNNDTSPCSHFRSVRHAQEWSRNTSCQCLMIPPPS